MALAQLAERLIMLVEIPESIPVMGYFIAVKCTFLERENAELMKRMLGIKGMTSWFNGFCCANY